MTLRLGRAEIKIEKKGHVRRRAKPPTKKREKLRTAVPADTATAGPKRTTTVGPAETNTAPSSTSPAQCPAVDSQRLEHIAASTTNPTLNTTDAHAKPLNPMVELDQWENYIIILAIIVRFILAILDMLLHSISSFFTALLLPKTIHDFFFSLMSITVFFVAGYIGCQYRALVLRLTASPPSPPPPPSEVTATHAPSNNTTPDQTAGSIAVVNDKGPDARAVTTDNDVTETSTSSDPTAQARHVVPAPRKYPVKQSFLTRWMWATSQQVRQ